MVTASGTLVVNSYCQEDRLWLGGSGGEATVEAIVHPPVIMECETADTIFYATTCGEAGNAYRHIFHAVQEGSLGCALILDIADSAASNLRNLKYMATWIQRVVARSKNIMFKFVRCDGHQFHLSASIALLRASVASPLFSASTMLRAGANKWRMKAALWSIVQEELQWEQGGEPAAETRQYTQFVLRQTLMRHLLDVGSDDAAAGGDDSADRQLRARQRAAVQSQIDRIACILNFDWRRARIGHRCRRVDA